MSTDVVKDPSGFTLTRVGVAAEPGRTTLTL
jgi:hypothetical protein